MQAYEPAPEGGMPNAPAESAAFTVARSKAALQRYSWLIAITTIVGLAVGALATRLIEPEYVVNATVFATPTSQTGGGRGGPISDGALTQNAGWKDLLKTPAITDPVVRQLALYLRPARATDSLVFANFTIDATKNGFRPGDYTLKTENGRFTLTDKIGFTREQGTVGDSVGRTAGFAWVPPARFLGTKSRTIDFKVMTPREATLDIQSRFTVIPQDKSPVIFLVLRGTAAQRPTATLNAMLQQFVDVASELKKRELTQQTVTLGAQLQAAEGKLRSSEAALEGFRVRTISKPTESSVTLMGSATQAQNLQVSQPAFDAYFAHKGEVESVRRDRATLEQIAQSLRSPNSPTAADAILSVPTVAADGGAEALRTAVKDLNDKQRTLRQALVTFTDAEPQVITAKRDLAEVRDRVLPARLGEYLDILRSREQILTTQLTDATRELQEIPSRTIEQGALERERNVNADIYTRLRAAYAEANLAQQSAVPDVKVLDSAVTPFQPSTNTAPKIIGGALVAGLGLGIVLALLLDRLDSRFRYPEQASDELGLNVLGVVPRIDQSGRQQAPETIAQIVESFRSIRMNVRYASVMQPAIAVGITSPGPGDGKSLVASNLALSFAEGGWRTVLIDADTRRGQLNTTFDLPTSPGLIEYLEGTSLLGEILHPTRHDNLTVVPCGTRHRRAPELLATPRMQQLIASLGSEFDVILIDTPPLGAGTDAYAIGTACGQLALVLRTNRTNLKMAKAKLATVAQLPITMLGAILNEARTDSSMYQYYAYDSEYMLPEEAPTLGAGHETTAVAVRH